MGPREETRLTIVLPLGFRQNLFPPVPGTASESFPLPKMKERLATARAGGKGPECRGTGCGQSLLAGSPGSGSWSKLTGRTPAGAEY